MSAESMGRRLLAEVQQESLDELISHLRHTANPRPKDIFALPRLDRLLEIFRAPPPTQYAPDLDWTSPGRPEDDASSRIGASTPARPRTATPSNAPKAKPAVIQLSSSHLASGKTNLLYFLTTLAVLPKVYSGRSQSAVWLDTDGRFSARRLHEVITSDLTTKGSSEKDSVAGEALRHIHVFRPVSSSQLLSTLQHLPKYLLGLIDPDNHINGLRSLGLIVIDSASAFHWQDRFDAEITRFEAVRTEEAPNTRSSTSRSRTFEVIAQLKLLQKLFDCTLIFTSSTNMRPGGIANSLGVDSITTSDGRQPPREPQRINPWTAFATLSLSISQIKIPQFAGQMSLEECVRDQTNRLAAISKSRFVASVDWTTHDGLVGVDGDSFSKLDGHGNFPFKITDDGVTVQE